MCGFLKGWREEWRQRPQKGKEVPGCVLLEVTGFQQDVPNWTVKVGSIVVGQQEAKVQDMRQTAWGRVTFRPRLNISGKGGGNSGESFQTLRADCRQELYVP